MRVHRGFVDGTVPACDDRPVPIVCENEEATERFGRALAEALAAGDVILLEGGLGAGKTTLVRSVVRALGLPEDEPVTSPSFAVLQEYDTELPVLHADLYRLAHPDELLQLGLYEQLGAGAVALVEWGLMHADALGRVDLVLHLTGSGDSARRIELEPRTGRGEILTTRLRAAFRNGS